MTAERPDRSSTQSSAPAAERLRDALTTWDPAARWPEPPAGLWHRIRTRSATLEQAAMGGRRRAAWAGAFALALLLATALGIGLRSEPPPTPTRFAALTPATTPVRVALRGPRGTRLLLSVEPNALAPP